MLLSVYRPASTLSRWGSSYFFIQTNRKEAMKNYLLGFISGMVFIIKMILKFLIELLK